MKLVKFRDYLVPLVLSGDKNSTWRLFDDKDLTVGDDIDLREFGKDTSFARGKIVRIIEKPLGELTEADRRGHERFASAELMYKTFSGYYNTNVGPDTIVKIIWFELTERF